MSNVIDLALYRARRSLPPDVLDLVDLDAEISASEEAMARAEQRMDLFPFGSEPWATALESYVVALADRKELEAERRKVVGEVANV